MQDPRKKTNQTEALAQGNSLKDQHWQEYLDLLEKIGLLLVDLSQLLENKTKAVEASELTVLDEIMKKEQAFSLTLRGMEQKRLSALEKLEIPSVPLNQLMKHVPRSHHAQAKGVVEKVQGQYSDFQVASQEAHRVLEEHLHQIQVRTGQVEPNYAKPRPEDLPTPEQEILIQRIKRKAPGNLRTSGTEEKVGLVRDQTLEQALLSQNQKQGEDGGKSSEDGGAQQGTTVRV